MKKIIIILCAAMSLVSLCACSSKKATIVPDFTGHDVAEVYEWCGSIPEKYACEVSYTDGNGVERDQVIEQSVKGGSRLESDISFKISNGAYPEITVLHITEKTEKADVEAWKESSGLVDLTYVEEYSDSVAKNHVIRIEPSSGIHQDTKVTAYISKGKEKPPVPESTDIEVKFGDYIGITVEEFEQKAKALGLKPNHNASRDKFSADVKFGNIVWHGSGTYVKDEIFNYGICINEIYVSAGQFVGNTEDLFIENAKKLSLKPTHISGRDAYSTKIDKGDVVTHGYGVYEKDEEFKYGLSLGAAKVQSGYEGASEEVLINYLSSMGLKGKKAVATSETVAAGRVISYNCGKYSTGDSVSYVVSAGPEPKVDVPDFTGKSEAELLDFLKKNGLLAGERTTQSYLMPEGTIISNDTGTMKKGSSVRYVVSTGPVVPKSKLDSFEDIKTMLSDTELGFLSTCNRVETYLNTKGFYNYEIIPAYSETEPDGAILSIMVGDEPLSRAKEYSIYEPIVVTVSAELVG